MKIRRVLLVVFGLAVVVFAAYALNRGVLIGSEIHRGSTSLQDGATAYLWRKHCRYLRFTGINDDASMTATIVSSRTNSASAAPVRLFGVRCAASDSGSHEAAASSSR